GDTSSRRNLKQREETHSHARKEEEEGGSTEESQEGEGSAGEIGRVAEYERKGSRSAHQSTQEEEVTQIMAKRSSIRMHNWGGPLKPRGAGEKTPLKTPKLKQSAKRKL
ncbi:unnamed protein product, partial [marine sediment metagenome]